MKDLINDINWQYLIKIACGVAAGCIMDSLGVGITSWQLWAMLAVLVVSEWNTRKRTEDEVIMSIVQGMAKEYNGQQQAF